MWRFILYVQWRNGKNKRIIWRLDVEPFLERTTIDVKTRNVRYEELKIFSCSPYEIDAAWKFIKKSKYTYH